MSIPLPFVDYAGSPRNTTLVSPIDESANIIRRSRFQKSYVSVSVSWILTDAQYTAFKNYFETDLDVGTSQFKIELRFPQNSALQEWAVRFVGGFEATPIGGGNWEVQAEVDLIEITTLADGSPLIGWVQFFTAAGLESDIEDDEPFYVDNTHPDSFGDDVLFYVRE